MEREESHRHRLAQILNGVSEGRGEEMWTSIANLKENLNKITLDMHGDDDEELEIYGSENRRHSTFSDRRNSHTFAHSKPIGRYRAEIKKLQESEAEIKSLSVNYVALLREKEEQIFRVNQENGSLKQNLNAINAAPSAARSEISKVSNNGINALKGKGDQSANRQHKSTSLMKNCYAGNQMSNGLSSKHDEELADLLEEKTRSLEAIQASHESQIKQFQMELEKEHDKLVNEQIRLQELSKIRNESNEKTIEISHLQKELNRQEDETSDDTMENMKRLAATLEKENTQAALESSKKASTDKIDPIPSKNL
ncbi:hypothetical protein Goari_013577, partial [Gossypium aridum]|nr:hypothetical protein [Gossypium aridum]